jgi:hypothetical protein
VLLPSANSLQEVDEVFRSILTTEKIVSIVSLIPTEWLISESDPDANENTKIYEQFLLNRVHHSENFIKEAQNAKQVPV